MHWEKKICIRLTTRRIVGAILVASTVANVVIVGAVFDAASSSPAPTITSELTSPLSTSTSFMPTGTSVENFASTHTSGSTPVSTGMSSQTFTPTQASINIPTLWIVCIKRFYWRIYRVQQGETLYSLAPAMGTTVNELIAANCLPNDQVYVGQQLYVPRLPGTVITVTLSFTPTDTPSFTPTSTHTATPTDTPSLTPTNTPSFTPTNTPTDTPTYTSTSTSTPSPTATFTETNFPPSVSITLPQDGSQYPYSGYDSNLNLWFTTLELRGSASDPEDDVLTDSSLIWSTDLKEIQNTILGNGIIVVDATLYSNVCSGLSHTITLTGTDSKGAIDTATTTIFIGAGQLC